MKRTLLTLTALVLSVSMAVCAGSDYTTPISKANIKNQVTKNNKTQFYANAATDVNAVADGVVTGVSKVSSKGEKKYFIIVRQGETLMVYSNLNATSVKKNQTITTSTIIGNLAAGAYVEVGLFSKKKYEPITFK